MLGAIERAHSGVTLIPDADVLQLSVVGISGCEHFSHVAPIHADLVDRAVGRMPAEQGIYIGEEGRELAFAHFAGGHGEFTVLDATQPGHVAINLHVIGWVRKDELGLVIIHQPVSYTHLRAHETDSYLVCRL